MTSYASGTVPTTKIRLSDVADTIDEDTDLREVCRSTKVNRFSRYKPYQSTVTTATDADRTAHNWGNELVLVPLASILADTEDGQFDRTPITGPSRLADFGGYKHSAKKPYYSLNPTSTHTFVEFSTYASRVEAEDDSVEFKIWHNVSDTKTMSFRWCRQSGYTDITRDGFEVGFVIGEYVDNGWHTAFILAEEMWTGNNTTTLTLKRSSYDFVMSHRYVVAPVIKPKLSSWAYPLMRETGMTRVTTVTVQDKTLNMEVVKTALYYQGGLTLQRGRYDNQVIYNEQTRQGVGREPFLSGGSLIFAFEMDDIFRPSQIIQALASDCVLTLHRGYTTVEIRGNGAALHFGSLNAGEPLDLGTPSATLGDIMEYDTWAVNFPIEPSDWPFSGYGYEVEVRFRCHVGSQPLYSDYAVGTLLCED